MKDFSVREVERVLRVSRSAIRSLVTAGLAKPSRGRRQELRFSFQDLIILRAARALIDADVPRRRVHRTLRELRKRLPETVPLSGLRLCAVGERVVIHEGDARWQVDDGQYLLGLEPGRSNGALRIIERDTPDASSSVADQFAAQALFAQALELESHDPQAAAALYEQAVERDEYQMAAWTNWGRLLQERGDLPKAEDIYRTALARCGPDALVLFNLGVLLEDTGRMDAAVQAYRSAVEHDPGLADAHYNLARLYECSGKLQNAVRHYGQYRKLSMR